MSHRNGMSDPMNEAVELDARGLLCPMPLLKLKQKLNQMQSGQFIEVTTTDIGSVRDFSAFLAQVGHILHQQTEQGGEYHFLIEKANQG